eukprot:scaffold47821_cov29-Tisochrysis_lutea.AAC.5
MQRQWRQATVYGDLRAGESILSARTFVEDEGSGESARTCFCCVGSRPKRFLQMSRCFENLSSGEKRAGCADSVGLPSGASFCRAYAGND